MTKQNFPFYFLLQERAKPILPLSLRPHPPRTNSNPSPSALTHRPRTTAPEHKPAKPPSKDFVACGSALRVKDSIKQKGFTRAFLIKPLVLPFLKPTHPPSSVL